MYTVLFYPYRTYVSVGVFLGQPQILHIRIKFTGDESLTKYEVRQQPDEQYMIVDTEMFCALDDLDRCACQILFLSKASAELVCKLMNDEYQKYLT